MPQRLGQRLGPDEASVPLGGPQCRLEGATLIRVPLKGPNSTWHGEGRGWGKGLGRQGQRGLVVNRLCQR